jgi:hypothetical protein
MFSATTISSSVMQRHGPRLRMSSALNKELNASEAPLFHYAAARDMRSRQLLRIEADEQRRAIRSGIDRWCQLSFG